MLEFTASLIPALFIFLYVLFSSLEIGFSVFHTFSRKFFFIKQVKVLCKPLWGTTNLFLVGAIISLLTLFPGTTDTLESKLAPVFYIALACIVLRTVGIVLIFYMKREDKFSRSLYIGGSITGSLALTNVFVFLLTGEAGNLFISSLSLYFYILNASVVLLVSASFFSYVEKRPPVTLLKLRDYSAVFFCGLAFISFLLFLDKVPHVIIDVVPQAGILAAGMVIILISMMLQSYKKKAGGFFFLSIFLVAIYYFCLFFMHLPYVIYPDFSIYNSFADNSFLLALQIMFLVGMVFILPSSILLYYALVKKRHEV